MNFSSRNRVRGVILGASLLTGLFAAGCTRQESSAPAAAAPVTSASLPGGLQPAASVLDLMLDPIDSSADALWEAVATVSTASGTEDLHPRTDAEWKSLRHKALALMEAANLLVIEGRPVAHPGQQLEEAGGPGDFTPAQAQQAVDADRAAFVAFAKALQTASGDLLLAIDKRDIEAYLYAGGILDEACEACHTKFWYPNAIKPPGL